MRPVGLALARELWAEEVAPRLGDLAEAVAAGLVGEGSECFGFDDELSRDHDWGPALCLWLRRADRDAAPPIRAALAGLPPTFKGHRLRRPSPEAAHRTGLLEVEGFYRRFTGLERPPETPEAWMACPGFALAACTNGAVFADGPGAFTAHRNALLAFYPEPVRRLKLAAHLEAAAQGGQYNMPRAFKRSDRVAAALALAAFLRHAMAAAFLLARRYPPFSKWTHRALGELPDPGPELAHCLAELARATTLRAASGRVEAAAALITGALRREGLPTGPGLFLLDPARRIREGIEDPHLRALNPRID